MYMKRDLLKPAEPEATNKRSVPRHASTRLSARSSGTIPRNASTRLASIKLSASTSIKLSASSARSSGTTPRLASTMLQNYRQDFGKYGKRINNVMLEKVFMKIPGLVGANVKYAAIDKETNSRNVKNALELLEKARIALRIRATSGAGLPLTAYADDTKIKLLFLDVGLLQNAMGISRETYLAADLCAGYRGAVTEQFIGQQILALKKPYEDPELYYWRRDARGSEAEVDFLYQYGEKILPIEVKSGKTGSLKSLRLFLKEYGTPFGIRFSQQPLSFTDRVLSIPLYAVEALPKLVGELLGAANMS